MNQLKTLYRKVSRNDLIRSHAKQIQTIRYGNAMIHHLLKRWLADKTDCAKCTKDWK